MATCTSHRGWRWTSCEGECECVSGKGGGRGREEGREGGVGVESLGAVRADSGSREGEREHVCTRS